MVMCRCGMGYGSCDKNYLCICAFFGEVDIVHFKFWKLRENIYEGKKRDVWFYWVD